MFRVLIRVIADAVVIATVLFAAAGTLAWPRAWVLIAVLLVVRIASAIAVFRVNPGLLCERATVLVHGRQPWTDRLILFAFMGTAFIGVPAIAALDVFHWHLLPSPPPVPAGAGLVAFALGWTIIAVALRANPFAVTVVRLQSERQHAVVDTGIYGVIRLGRWTGAGVAGVQIAAFLNERTANA